MAKNIGYKTLSREIIDNIIEGLAPIDELDNKNAFVNVLLNKDLKTKALNIAMTTYINTVNYTLNITQGGEFIPLRKVMSELLNEIVDVEYDDAVDIIQNRIRTEFNSAKRKERYKREKALERGEDYYSPIVDFVDVDKSKIKENVVEPTLNTSKTDNEVTVTDEDFDVYEMLKQKKAEIITKKKEEVENDNSGVVPNLGIRLSEPKEEVVQEDRPNPTVATRPLNEPVGVEEYIFSRKVETITTRDYEMFNEEKHKLYKLRISGTKKPVFVIGDFRFDIISNTVNTNKYFDKDTKMEVDDIRYDWNINLYIATNDDILDIEKELRNYDMLSNSSIIVERIKRFPGQSFVSII